MLSLIDKEAMLQAQLGYVLEPALISEMAKLAKIRETTMDEIIVRVGDRLQLIPILIKFVSKYNSLSFCK